MEDKWAFCPEKECYYCEEDIGELDIKENVITNCPKCARSFVD